MAGAGRQVFCGIDWAEDHHDVALVDAAGTALARLRISDDAARFADAKAIRAYAGGAPVTRASGKSTVDRLRVRSAGVWPGFGSTGAAGR
jgi:hypothetical protein